MLPSSTPPATPAPAFPPLPPAPPKVKRSPRPSQENLLYWFDSGVRWRLIAEGDALGRARWLHEASVSFVLAEAYACGIDPMPWLLVKDLLQGPAPSPEAVASPSATSLNPQNHPSVSPDSEGSDGPFRSHEGGRAGSEGMSRSSEVLLAAVSGEGAER
jgi:hypothetical protein